MIDTLHFTPGWSLTGGMIIGLAAALLILLNGRIAGISSILGNSLKPQRDDALWRWMFLFGLMLSPLPAMLIGKPPVVDIPVGWGELLCAGFLVGIGTRYANGCTSGHGVCGLSSGSVRSLAATLVFMAFGFLTVYVRRHWIGA